MGKAADRGKAVDQKLEPLIFVLRGQRVILDADLARLYGVTTKRFNEGLRKLLKKKRIRALSWQARCVTALSFTARGRLPSTAR
jgi:ORF6N domain-containing protein